MASGNSYARPRLLAAAKAGDAQLVARLLCEGSDMNEATNLATRHLSWRHGHVEVVRLHLARQSVEVSKTTQNGATALVIAS
jgi:hypothetical protein